MNLFCFKLYIYITLVIKIRRQPAIFLISMSLLSAIEMILTGEKEQFWAFFRSYKSFQEFILKHKIENFNMIFKKGLHLIYLSANGINLAPSGEFLIWQNIELSLPEG